MPMPPILPTVDWKGLFDGGADFETWMKNGENEGNVNTLRDMKEDMVLDDEVVEAVKAIDRPMHIVAIAEDWCPDVIRHVPVVEKMAELNANIRTRYISRKQSPETFIRFLTVGGEAIPKFIFLSEDFVECGNWGPMQEGLRELIARGKACGDVMAARKKVFKEYQADSMCKTASREILHLVDIASSAEV